MEEAEGAEIKKIRPRALLFEFNAALWRLSGFPGGRRGGSFFSFVANLPVTFQPSLKLNHPDERDIMLVKWIPVVCATAGFIYFYVSCYLTVFFLLLLLASSIHRHLACFSAHLSWAVVSGLEMHLHFHWCSPWPLVAHLHLLQRHTRATQLVTPPPHPPPSHLKVSDL